jgi:hypothetical protein
MDVTRPLADAGAHRRRPVLDEAEGAGQAGAGRVIGRFLSSSSPARRAGRPAGTGSGDGPDGLGEHAPPPDVEDHDLGADRPQGVRAPRGGRRRRPRPNRRMSRRPRRARSARRGSRPAGARCPLRPAAGPSTAPAAPPVPVPGDAAHGAAHHDVDGADVEVVGDADAGHRRLRYLGSTVGGEDTPNLEGRATFRWLHNVGCTRRPDDRDEVRPHCFKGWLHRGSPPP